MIFNDIFLIGFELLSALLLYLLAGYAAKVLNNKWRICYCIPAIVCLFMVALAGFEKSLLGVYIGSFFLLAGFFKDTKKIRQKASVTAFVCIIVSIPVCLCYSGYRTPDYVKEFEKGFETMKEHYILTEHKRIDWEALYEKYLPQFEEVNVAHDEVGNYIVWKSFCEEFYDGHVYFQPKDEAVIELAGERMYGNDYGLSLMNLENGQTVAVNVEEGSEVYKAGIKNGTIITLWDGKEPKNIAKEIEVAITSYPDKENEKFYEALLVAGIGGESVEITYLDEEGNEQIARVSKLGAYNVRLKETLEVLHQGVAAGNLQWTAINENTACFRMKQMMYDADTYSSGEYTKMQSEIREKLIELKEQGVTNLIIDLRSNAGGSPHMIMAIAALFAKEGEHYYCNEGVWDTKTVSYQTQPDTGKYIPGGALYYYGEDLWKDGKIVILVNSESVSAADHFVAIMSELDNVTTMGFTKSNGSGQAVSGVELESGSLSFSAIPVIDKKGNLFIDSDTSHEIGVDIDIKIPFDENAVKCLFEQDEDYIMKKALEMCDFVNDVE